MANATLTTIVTLFSLVACTDELKVAPKAAPSAETVQLVLFFSDGDKDFKSVGETLLLNTGETVKVQRGVIRPDASLITQDWNGRFLPAARGIPVAGSVDLRLDRTNGVICEGMTCAYLYDICPHMSLLEAGSKCQAFAKKQGE